MTVTGQELLTSGASHPSPWSERTRAVSETATPPARPAFGPERREFTLGVSRRLYESPWFPEMLSRIRRLMALGDNWNGYGERAVHDGALKRAVGVLGVIGVDGPCPDIVPTSGGGVQLEWTSADCEIEVEIPPVGLASVYVAESSGEESEFSAGARNRVWEQLRERIAEMGAAAG